MKIDLVTLKATDSQVVGGAMAHYEEQIKILNEAMVQAIRDNDANRIDTLEGYLVAYHQLKREGA